MIPDVLERHGHRLLDGLLVTAELVSISIVLGALLAVPLTAARLSQNRIIGGFAFGYVYFFSRHAAAGTDFSVYYGRPVRRRIESGGGLWAFFREAFNARCSPFSLKHGGLSGRESIAARFGPVPRGQLERHNAARGRAERLPISKVVLPKAAIVALRRLGHGSSC